MSPTFPCASGLSARSATVKYIRAACACGDVSCEAAPGDRLHAAQRCVPACYLSLLIHRRPCQAGDPVVMAAILRSDLQLSSLPHCSGPSQVRRFPSCSRCHSARATPVRSLSNMTAISCSRAIFARTQAPGIWLAWLLKRRARLPLWHRQLPTPSLARVA